MFGRKKEVEATVTSDLEVPRSSARPKVSRVRKEKEKSKPWGRSERLLVLIPLLFTVVLAVFLALSARSWKLPGMPRIALPELSFEKKIIVEKKPEKDYLNEVKNIFIQKTNGLSGVWGLYFYSFEDDYEALVAGDEIFQAASLIKLPIMAALYKESDQGRISLSSKVSLKEEDKIGGSGNLYSKDAGTSYTYQEPLNLMGKNSDNTAQNIIRKRLGDKLVIEFINNIGMLNTSLEENETTPRDIGLFFRKLYEEDLLETESTEALLDSLTNTSYEEWIVKGIPEVKVAHKYGREIHVVNDAGIVFSQKPYILVILSKGVVESEADNIFPEIAKSIHELAISQAVN